MRDAIFLPKDGMRAFWYAHNRVNEPSVRKDQLETRRLVESFGEEA